MPSQQLLNGHAAQQKYIMDDKSLQEVAKAEKLKEKGEWAKAEKKIARVIKKYPDCVPALQIMGISQIKLNKLPQAYKTYSTALQHRPHDDVSLKNRAMIAFELWDKEKIEHDFTAALEVIQNDPALFTLYGAYLHRQQRETEALPYYKQAIESDPDLHNSKEALLSMASILRKYNEHQTALDLWLAYLEKNPKNAEIMCYVADTMYYLGRKEEALEMAIQSLAHNPDDEKAQAVFTLVLRDIHIKDFSNPIFQSLYYCLSVGKSDFYGIYGQWQNLLLLNPEFEAMKELRINPSKWDNLEIEDDKLKANLFHPYFLLGLRYMLQADGNQEIFLMRLRHKLLDKLINKALDDSWRPLLCAMAEACFMNEYVWAISKDEAAIIKGLKAECEAIKSVEDGKDKISDVLLLGAYTPLKDLKSIEILNKVLDSAGDQGVKDMCKLQIKNPIQEAKIRTEIDSLSDIQDDVSQKVRAQYEVNPYPRWRTSYVAPPSTVTKYEFKPREVLIAGCGTGRHVTITATQEHSANILALDLSLSSLSYAKRQIDELGIPNISYIQGDILEVEKLGKQFDHIESAGVLHHMDNPLEGWRQLVNILKPGGTMRIGLYSELARQGVVAMRKEIEEKGFKDDQDGIRAARLHVLNAPHDSILKSLMVSGDFYSSSACRDLIMHVQEHRYTIERLTNELIELGLEFTGMCPSAARQLIDYAKQYPNDPHFVNLPQLKKFEEANPRTFGKMYQFTVRKPA